MGDHNGSWRFDWPMLHDEARRVLGLMAGASGQGAFGLVGVE